MKTLQDKVVLVTGGGMGIGRAMCQVAAREGAKVVIADFDATAGKETEALLAAAGTEALFVEVDLTDEARVKAMIDQTVEHFGRLDCACNNAARSLGQGPVQLFEREGFEQTIEYCLTNTWLCMKYEIEAMLKQGGGTIVNTSSNASLNGHPNNTPYATAKGGVNILTKSTAGEVAKQGIRINAVSPGVIRTPGVAKYIKDYPEVEASMSKAAAMGRLGEPEEIAEAAMFLCSDRAAFITGQILSVDGGASVRG